MPIIAVYYGTSTSDVDTITSQSHVDLIVLNRTAGPYTSAGAIDDNVAAMVQKAHDNGKKAFGYVDSGGVNRPLSITLCSAKVTASGCYSVNEAPSLCGSNPSGGLWNHWAWNSSEFNLGTSSSNYGHCYLDYGGTLRSQVARGAVTSGWFSCFNVIGYVQDQVDQWLSPHTGPGTGYGANGIWYDNAYVGSVNDTTNASNDPRYIWYKKLCTYVTGADGGTYNNKGFQVLLNAGSSTGASYWYNSESGGTSFFTYITIRESDYSNDGTSYFPTDGTQTYGTHDLPSFITASPQSYENKLFALLKNASGISSTLVNAWYSQSCAMGIKFAYVATGSGGSFDLPSGNASISNQNTDAGLTSC